jgi:hypothetical protein
MNRSPEASRSLPPSPRSASEMRKLLAIGWYSTVGWNCTNSRFDTTAPIR